MYVLIAGGGKVGANLTRSLLRMPTRARASASALADMSRPVARKPWSESSSSTAPDP